MRGKQISLFEEIEISDDVFCKGCGRVISSEKSVERMHGPTCWINYLEGMVKHEPEPPELPARLPVKRTKVNQ